MKVAVIGAGISGLTAAYKLAPSCDVTVFESAERLGGHTATIDITHRGQDWAIDTGFIVFNEWTYPNFIALLRELNVEVQETEMSFSVSCQDTGLEYGGNNLNTLFAQRRNIVSPYFLRLVKDIVRFNKQSVLDLQAGRITIEQTLDEYLTAESYSPGFIRHYLVPMGSAIWSCGFEEMLQFPVAFFIQFFSNHGLLSVSHRPQWYTIKSGSRSYIEPLIKNLQDRVRLGAKIDSVTRRENTVVIRSHESRNEEFDEVILACHSDQALSIIKDPSASEVSILGAIPYQNNEVILHTDTELLPNLQSTWSSWNYLLQKETTHKPVLTYNMNILQSLESEDTFCVTLNATDRVDPSKMLGRFDYSHPQFTVQGITAQQRWQEINGVNNTWFCGAYWGNGFHEDGVVSAMRVCEQLQKVIHD
jgi:predicted NAD/FAD-binding protein